MKKRGSSHPKVSGATGGLWFLPPVALSALLCAQMPLSAGEQAATSYSYPALFPAQAALKAADGEDIPPEPKKDDKSADKVKEQNEAQEDGKSALTQRKIVQPSSEHFYVSAKKLELNGEDAVREAMAIYRMALHNGAQGVAKEEAYLGLARCEYRLGNYWQSYKAVESSFPQEFEHAKIQLRSRMEMDLAQLLAQKKSEPIPGSEEKGGKPMTGYQAGAAVYNTVIYNDPKSEFARQALRYRGLCLKDAGELEEAEKSYYMLVNTYPSSREALEAGPEMVELQALKSRGEGGLRGKKYDEAINRLRQSKTVTSAGEDFNGKIEKAQQAVDESAAETRLKEAQYYRSRGGRKGNDAAEYILADIIKRYPQTQAGQEAQKIFEKNYGKNGGR